MQGTPKAPQTRAGLEQLQEQRAELIRQINDVTSRRGRLVQERLNAQAASNQVVAKEYETRIAELGQRARLLEVEKDRTDDMIRDALARGVGQAEEAKVAVEAAPAIANVEWAVATPPPLREQALGFVNDNAVSLLLGEALLFVLGGVVLWRTLARRVVRSTPSTAQLQTSVDAIALEVERISENQRYVTRLLNEKLLGEGSAAAQPIQSRDKAEVPR